MIQDDYILRMIRQATELMGKLLQFKNVGDTNNVLKVVQQAYDELLRIDPLLVEKMPAEQLIPLLKEKYDWQLAQFQLLADLLYESGLLCQDDGAQNEARQKFQKALLLYTFVNQHDSVYDMNRTAKISVLSKLLSTPT